MSNVMEFLFPIRKFWSISKGILFFSVFSFLTSSVCVARVYNSIGLEPYYLHSIGNTVYFKVIIVPNSLNIGEMDQISDDILDIISKKFKKKGLNHIGLKRIMIHKSFSVETIKNKRRGISHRTTKHHIHDGDGNMHEECKILEFIFTFKNQNDAYNANVLLNKGSDIWNEIIYLSSNNYGKYL